MRDKGISKVDAVRYLLGKQDRAEELELPVLLRASGCLADNAKVWGRDLTSWEGKTANWDASAGMVFQAEAGQDRTEQDSSTHR